MLHMITGFKRSKSQQQHVTAWVGAIHAALHVVIATSEFICNTHSVCGMMIFCIVSLVGLLPALHVYCGSFSELGLPLRYLQLTLAFLVDQ